MATYFRYKLITAQGRVEGGVREFPFDDVFAAIDALERSGGTVLYSQPIPAILGAIHGFGNRILRGSVGRGVLADALNNMSVMLRAGMPLHMVVRETLVLNSHKALAHAGSEMLLDVENGLTLAESTEQKKHVFPDLVVYLIRLGEETGSLDRTVGDAAEHLKRMDTIIGQTKRALVMPAFTLTAIFGAMIFWLIMVVPQMRTLFASFQIQLPPLTLWVIAASSFLEQYVLSILATMGLVPVVLAALIKKSQPLRYQFHTLLYNLPIIGSLVQLSALAFITEYLSLMNSAGVDMLRALDIMHDITANELYKEKIGDIRLSLTRGLSLQESFANAKVFPSFVVQMIGVGEQSGTVDTQLKYIADEYRRRLANMVDNLGKLIEPISILIGGGFFALLAASMFLPIYGMISKIH